MSHCSDSTTCPNGDCAGCDDGVIWCYDPRCAPYCKGCTMPASHDYAATIVVAIIAILLFLLLILSIYLAYHR